MTDSVTQYCNDVLEGKVITGRLVKLACERHLNDLERSKTNDFAYRFDVEKAERIIRFAEKLVIDEGDEILPLRLYGFQKFILGSLMGWVYKDSGYRRFRSSYISVGRQCGKSLLNGVLGTYLSGFSGYRNGRIICSATKLSQAEIVYDEVKKFILADKDLEQMFSIYKKPPTITAKTTGTSVLPIGRDTKSIDGFRSLLAITDELHSHKTNQMYKLLEGGQANMKEALISAITTRGFDLNSFCKEHEDYCIRILEGIVTNETQFIFIAALDKDDDIDDWRNWLKAKPLTLYNIDNIYNERNIDIFRAKFNEAREKGGFDLVDFKTKHLNMWVEFKDTQYLNLANWKLCESNLTLEDFRGKRAILGFDLSSGGDLTSIGLVFEEINNETFVHSHSFIPHERVLEHEQTDLVPYREWINDGLLTVTSGHKTDYKFIISYLKEIIEEYDLKIVAVGYDNHNASSFLSDLGELFPNIELVDIPQTCKGLNDATVDFKLTVDEKKVKYNCNNKLLQWSGANAITVNNSMGEIKIDKEGNKRIDPIDSIMDAWFLKIKKDKAYFEKIDLNEHIKKYGYSF